MADISNNYADGMPKWGSKKNFLAKADPIPPVVNERIISGLISQNILTDVQNISVKVIQNGSTVAHFILSQIASIDLIGSQLIVYSSDELPINLGFINSNEASLADARFTLCLNGGIAS